MRFLTDEEAGRLLDRGPSHVRYLRRSGKLRFLPGRPVRIPEDEIERYIEEELRTCHARTGARGSSGTPKAGGKSGGRKTDVPDAFLRALKARKLRSQR